MNVHCTHSHTHTHTHTHTHRLTCEGGDVWNEKYLHCAEIVDVFSEADASD